MEQTSHLEFHPLTFAEEPDGVTVGRSDTASYALLPADGAELLRRLSAGMSVRDAAAWYRAEFGEQIDMIDFVDSLRELGFVRADGEASAVAGPVRLHALGKAVFSPVAWFCYAAIGAAAIVAMFAEPAVRPSVHNLFFSSSLVLVQLVLALVQMPAVLWHEGFHMLAGRRLGLPTRLGVGRRWYYFVFETELNGLLGVPRSKRYLPFLAGMIGDLLLFCALTLVAAGGPSLVGRLALAVAYLTLLRLIWQTYLFLRTDLYYVLATALGCTNPHEATSAYLREKFHWLPGIRPSTVDTQDWSPRDRLVAPWFALITVAGLGFLAATAAFVVVPMTIEFGHRVGSALSGGIAAAPFWDSLLALVLLTVQFVVLPLLAGRRTPSSIREEAAA